MNDEVASGEVLWNAPDDPAHVVTDTDELRRFAPGRPPRELLTWFGSGGKRTIGEARPWPGRGGAPCSAV